jgi:23S rRNA (cytosine1962-C5)-methyltransferase
MWIGGEWLAAFAAAKTTAHRVYSGAEAWVERFGEDLLLSYQADVARDRVLAALPGWGKEHGCAYRRVFGKYLPMQNAERVAPVLIEGDATLPLTTVVEENGMRFGLDFAAGYSAGLFIDQRANRALMRRAGVKRLLNTFAYTCAFSVAAALAGAETVSVDLSKKSLDRGRENFALNGLATAADGRHRFLADDVLEVLPRLARKGEQFDAIVLDPPTFSRGNKGRKFQVERDLEALFLAALEVAAPGARILLSTNCTRLDRRALESIARYGLKVARRGGELHTEPELPDIPAGHGARTLWVTLRSG